MDRELTAWDAMWNYVCKRISEMDVSNVKDGDVININEDNNSINRIGDFGIDNKKEKYVFNPNGWRSLK